MAKHVWKLHLVFFSRAKLKCEIVLDIFHQLTAVLAMLWAIFCCATPTTSHTVYLLSRMYTHTHINRILVPLSLSLCYFVVGTGAAAAASTVTATVTTNAIVDSSTHKCVSILELCVSMALPCLSLWVSKSSMWMTMLMMMMIQPIVIAWIV